VQILLDPTGLKHCLIVVTVRLTRTPWQGTARFADQLHWAFVEADLWALRSIRFGVQIKHVLHRPDKLGTHAGNAPFFAQPGFEVVFLSTRCTVTGEISPTCLSSISRSASNPMVQRQRPLGGALQASATIKASCLPVKDRILPSRGCSLKAAVKPSSTKRWRVRCTVETPRWKVSAISASLAPSSASNSTRARATLRAVALPFLIRFSRYSCSSTVKSTIYLLALGGSSYPRLGRRGIPVKIYEMDH
jgi:hypothetical protein